MALELELEAAFKLEGSELSTEEGEEDDNDDDDDDDGDDNVSDELEEVDGG